MNSNDIAKRNDKSEKLKVFRLQDGQFYVESAEGKICYKVVISNGTKSCSCADYINGITKDSTFLCKHILAVINGNGNIKDVETAKDQTPKLEERFIIEIKRKDTVKEFVLYAGLLDLGHQKGIRKLSAVPVQYPTKDNNMEAICKALLESKNGEIFEEIGDANPKNVNYMVVEHILRVAATRAKARALRDFTNVAFVCLEELGNLDDDETINGYPKPKTRARKETKSETATHQKQDQSKGGTTTDDRKEEKKQTAKDAEAERKLSDSEAKTAGETKKDTKASDTADKKNQAKPSKAQVEAIEKLRERRGISGEQLVKIFTNKFNKPYENINSEEAKNFIKHLQQAA